ncbi:MAG: hypothetical protein Q4G51_17460 [Dermatophilus congolensis]|nr:hypothetical protein [Dermatophilus congolensis]
MREIEIRLIGHDGPDGELRADRAAGIAKSLDDLVLRLTREAAEMAGRGRPGVVIEKLGEVRLAGIDRGSTVLTFAIGDADALEIDPLSEPTQQMFDELVQGIAANHRPEFVTDTISEATDRLIAALQKAALEVDIAIDRRRSARLALATVSRDVWKPLDPGGEVTTLVGLLEAVDLRNAHFRLLDDAGNRIELIDVVNSEAVAPLAGSRVAATGTYAKASGAGRSRIEGASIAEFSLPALLLEAVAPLSGLPGIDAPGGLLPLPADLELSDEELDAFLAAIHE